MGVNQQKVLRLHGILGNLLPRKAYRRLSIGVENFPLKSVEKFSVKVYG